MPKIIRKKRERIYRYPRLDTILMVEKLLQQRSGEHTKYQLWKKLPKKMMYQTFSLILSYLLSSNKIIIDEDGVVTWTYDPKGIEQLLSNGMKLR